MNNQDFTTTILVDQTSRQAFDAITNVRGWWSEEIDGGTAELNDVFLYHYKDVHICKVKLEEVVPEEKVTWRVLNNYFSFVEDKTEWTDTRITFDIFREDNKTAVRFTHWGLVPDYECYHVCFDAWSNYVNNSLRSLITTGKGTPNPKEGEGFNAQIVEKWKLK